MLFFTCRKTVSVCCNRQNLNFFPTGKSRMKESDSTNSLTELTGRDECFICLSIENDKDEPLVSSKLLRTCGCRFFVHPQCWNEWMRGRTDFDCPICRKGSLRINIPPNPVLMIEIPREHRRKNSKLFLCGVILLSGFAIAILIAMLYPN